MRKPPPRTQLDPSVEEYLGEMYKSATRVRRLRDEGIGSMVAHRSMAARQLKLEILQGQMWASMLTAQIAFLGGDVFS